MRIQYLLIALAITASVYGQFTCSDAHASGSSAATCYCMAGYYGTSTDASGSGCAACPPGSNSQAATATGTLVSSCTCYDSNAQLKSDNSACQCMANFYGTPNSTSGGTSGCTACSNGQTAPAGSSTNVCAAATTSTKILSLIALFLLLAILI
ncbi:immobilization antigen (macronuclear) [Tetrahymena thermophila SB210]|uniref:Immobilization antigen n=1 Tax=Tetrahymena thermophila (strain SB210) TaxID=312017 RepID=Q232E4_TETTS|nr:immobilization antigen [Tetrahymena thermophila SB210]EAR91468.1 immobilization antigen [Tetrahymena thermophila SB210]|eukprot:XP_001011713.1 immobilization antigen [Tetrahymena thermophila SB210]